MRSRLALTAAALTAWLHSAAAADFSEPRTYDLFDWRATARLAATPICDVFRGGRFSADKYRTYQQLGRDILLAREAMNSRYGSESQYLDLVLPGDFQRPCR